MCKPLLFEIHAPCDIHRISPNLKSQKTTQKLLMDQFDFILLIPLLLALYKYYYNYDIITSLPEVIDG